MTVVVDTPAPAAHPIGAHLPRYNGPTDLVGQIQLAEYLAMAERVIPVDFRGRAADLLAVIQQARDLDIPVMTAVHHLWFERDGSGGMSAQLIGAILRRGGGDWTTVEVPNQSCTHDFRFADGRTAGAVTYTMHDALLAGIAGTDHWVEHPRDNLYARALALGARRFAQDMTLGLAYVAGEKRQVEVYSEPPVDEPVSDQVAAFLEALTPQSTPDDIRRLMKTAASKKVNLADEPAGGGLTVQQHLDNAWRTAVAREAAARELAADAALTRVDPVTADGPPGTGGADLGGPAGTGTAPCGCPTARLLAGQTHLAEVCNGRRDG